MSNLLLIPLEDSVVFPNMTVTLTVDVGDAERVFLVPMHEGEYAKVGTVAEVAERVRIPGGGTAVSLSGLHRGVAGAAHTEPDGRLWVEVEERPDEEPPRIQTARARARVPRGRRGDPRAAQADTADRVLRARDLRGRRARGYGRLRTRHQLRPRRWSCSRRSTSSRGSSWRCACSASGSPSCRSACASARTSRRALQKQQREYILRRQMESIRKELGEDDGSVADGYRTKLDELELPQEVREQAERESPGSSGWASRAASRR